MSDTVNRQVVITEIPKGELQESNFELTEGTIGEPGDGEILVKNLVLSLDAANRAWMQGATYREAVLAGDVMHGFTLGEVVKSNSSKFAPGDIVEAMGSWQEYSVLNEKVASKAPVSGSVTNQMSVYGVTGLTAYFGLLEVGQPAPGETVVVSAAAGAVGNVVGQIAKIKGCRAVGIAGGKEKCDWLVNELGFDAAVDYKAKSFSRDLKAACPDGIDVYFDNVGGNVLGIILFLMNSKGRIACCGAVSQYDTATPSGGPRGVPGLLVVKRLRMEGFIVMDYYSKRAEALAEMKSWVEGGKLKVVEDVIEGLENAPAALVGLLAGQNRGKRMIHIADPS